MTGLALTLPAEVLEEIVTEVAQRVRAELEADSPWMRRKDAASYLGVSDSWLAHTTEIPSYQDTPNGLVFYHRPDLDKWRLRNRR